MGRTLLSANFANIENPMGGSSAQRPALVEVAMPSQAGGQECPPHTNTESAAPDRDPAVWDPIEGTVERSSAGGALTHLSASFAACLNISTNIFRVSLPVCVFWFDGW